MPLPNGYLPRRGDVLILHGVVKFDVRDEESDHDHDGDLAVFVRLIGDHTEHRVKLSTVEGIKRRTWNEGDAVRNRTNDALFGQVVTMIGDVVLVKLDELSASGRSIEQLVLFHCNEIEAAVIP